ncbi:hypothetical protein ILYODFUR_004026 [Ilyodon furcidens]|uniref:Uncharacterized protein n=1 Tax=Ilyodon furcidens TaxID=33524 RepID=A0ABV0UQD3_9TELE
MRIKFACHLEILGTSGEAQNPLCFMSSVRFPFSDDLGCHDKLSCQGGNFRALHAYNSYCDADFIFQKDLAPAHTARSTNICFNNHSNSELDWSASSSDLDFRGNL